MGNGSEGKPVVITCQPLAGLAFFKSEDIEMRNVNITSCGAIQNSTSRYTRAFSSPFLKIQVAIFCSDCKNVLLTNVYVTESNSTGVVLYNPMGVIHIDRCHLIDNCMPDMEALMIPGGGGLVIEANNVTSQLFCTISSSIFAKNNASSGQYWCQLSPSTNPSGYFGLGRGGGISIVFRGGSANNTVLIDSVRIEDNMAQYGGGLYMAFSDTSGNNVTIVDTVVTENRALVVKGKNIISDKEPGPSTYVKGGGVFLHFITTNTKYPFNITIVITTSIFVSNTAQLAGGGLAIDVFSNLQSAVASNRLLIENCLFKNNIESSIHISQKGNCQEPLLYTTLCCSNFTNDGFTNIGSYSSSVFIESMPMTLKGTLIFTDPEHQALALKLHSSSIELLPSTHVCFFGNDVAILIIGCSSVVVNNGVNLLFVNNTAADYDFAVIISDSCSLDQPGSRKCFIRHSNSSLHPNDWGIK